ncbi:MAG: VWA domain-containing protein [Acidobacteriia bacterium]|nr:VWA domain-containing protein [Terriglobia bacterium]
MRTKNIVSVLLFVMAALGCRAQEAGAQPYTISDNVSLVVLDVSVRDPQGGYVSGLRREDFRVLEDGRPRTINQFASVDLPVTVGLVVDNSGSMLRKRPEVITAGLAFAKESNPQDEFFVINFNNSVVRGLAGRTLFTDDLQALRNALYFGQPQGQTALYDAVAYALKHLELSRQERRALIVVSDGGDNVSTTRLADLMRLIEASRATIYTVGLFDAEANELNPRVLQRFARASGGEYFEPDLAHIVPVLAKISKDLRNRYTLAFVPDTGDRRGVHTIRVAAQASNRKLIAHSRTSFLAEAPQAVGERGQ